MRRKLQLTAANGAIMVLIFWALCGANRGWTKTSVPRAIKDPVTGLEGVEYVSKFVPGVDFLGAGFLVSALIGAVAVAVPRRK